MAAVKKEGWLEVRCLAKPVKPADRGMWAPQLAAPEVRLSGSETNDTVSGMIDNVFPSALDLCNGLLPGLSPASVKIT